MAGLTKEQRAQRAAEKAAKEAAESAQTEEAAREAGAIDAETAVEGAVNQGGETHTEDRAEQGEEVEGVLPLRRHEDGRLSVGDQGQQPPAVETIRMVRDEPIHPGGPTSADVHPDEVDNWAAADWRVE